MKQLLTEAFSLDYPIRWIGILVTLKSRGVANTGGRRDAAFMVHEMDLHKLADNHHLDLGFRWLENASSRIYPLHFRRNYT